MWNIIQINRQFKEDTSMSKLKEFYNRLDEHIIRNQVINLSSEIINKGTPVAKIKLVDFSMGNGHFYISSDDDEDSNDLWLSCSRNSELKYDEPILFHKNIDMEVFYDAVKRLGNSVPKLTKFNKSFVIEFSEYNDINEIIGVLTWWRDTNAGCYISCFVDTNSDDSCYMDCGAYTIESDDDYNARLALEHEKAEKARLKALEKEESNRLRERADILDNIKRFEEQLKQFYAQLDSL